MAVKERKLIAFPVCPGMTPLDLVGPMTILRTLGRTLYRSVVVGERLDEVATDTRCDCGRPPPSPTSRIRGR